MLNIGSLLSCSLSYCRLMSAVSDLDNSLLIKRQRCFTADKVTADLA